MPIAFSRACPLAFPIALGAAILACTAVGISAAQTGVSPESATHLIICPTSMAPAFAPLAAHRTQSGTPSALVTLEAVMASTPPARDDAETLRQYLVQVHAAGALNFVLLVGDGATLPVRSVRSTFYPPGGFTDVPTDLYFAALDGDWDGDGDGVFGEAFASSTNPGDNADLDPDIAVGRAPVATIEQAERIVQAIVTYEHPGQGANVGSALLMAEVLSPPDWTGGSIGFDGATYAEIIRTRLQGLASPVSSTRLYENFTAYPGSQRLIPESAVAAMGSGQHGTVFYAGPGDWQSFSAGTGRVTLSQIDALGNAPNYFVAVALSSNCGAFTNGAILSHLATAPHGGSVAAVGFTAPVFPNTAWEYTEDFFVAATVAGGARVGEALQSNLRAHAPDTFYNTAARWTSLSMVLLGDPATPYRTEAGPVSDRASSLGGFKHRFR